MPTSSTGRMKRVLIGTTHENRYVGHGPRPCRSEVCLEECVWVYPIGTLRKHTLQADS